VLRQHSLDVQATKRPLLTLAAARLIATALALQGRSSGRFLSVRAARVVYSARRFPYTTRGFPSPERFCGLPPQAPPEYTQW